MDKEKWWAYWPSVCDSDEPCSGDCDTCPLCSEALITRPENYEPDDAQLEMGFDPYEGCYTYDC